MKQKQTKKGKGKKIFLALLFLLGLAILLYPFFSDWYYRVENSQEATDFKAARDEIPKEELDERMKLAEAYNAALNNVPDDDPFSEENKKEGLAHYAQMLEVHQKIGVVEYPAVNIRLPIYAGTSPEVLEMGAGHLEGTSLPIGGNSSHAVITAHSGLPRVKLFTDLHKAQVGDKFYVTNIKETMAYQVDQIHTIDPSDFSELTIVEGHDYVTLLTCTPVGVNSHRLIVRGHRIPYTPAVDEAPLAENQTNFWYRNLFYVALAIIVALLIIILSMKRNRKRLEAEAKAAEEAQAAADQRIPQRGWPDGGEDDDDQTR